MTQESALDSTQAFFAQHTRLVEQLHVAANCPRWALSIEDFCEALRRSSEKRFRGSSASAIQVKEYAESLHLEDLALACACAQGSEAAWEFFIAHFRRDLRNAARAILRSSGLTDEARAEDFADSLYADLYGIGSTSGVRRKSLFEYFHGRSKLSTWLRAVLTQRHVDQMRSAKRTISLDGEDGDIFPGPAERSIPAPADPDREKYLARLDGALSTALAEMQPRDRMLLALYYVDELTLAQIGRAVGEHESTVSRQLDRVRHQLRGSVTRSLLRGASAREGHPAEPSLDQAQVDLAFEFALEDWPFDLARTLSSGKTVTSPPK
jgi:RNA polymerase sigma-70 factor